jgi:predicted CXXCH cytochrome family protein
VIHPALKSKCTNCHSPHESTNPSLLKKNYNDTCTKCHDAPNADLPIQHSALIMAKSCVRCHEPHSSSRKNLLKDRTAILCAYCHTDIGKGLMDQNNTNHPAAIMGCQNCHDPHGSDNEKLLKSATINELCFKCHDKAGFNGGHPRPGHPISGIPDPLYPNKELSCISCHKPHYSPNEKLLRYNFMKAPYDKTICSVCHWQVLLPPPGPPRPPWND